jgi:CheY-like chemotaxis protein
MIQHFRAGTVQPTTAERPQILVVDDEPAFCGVMSELLKSFGYMVRFAYNVSQALEHLSQDPPDLILTDVMMPGTDGLSLIRRIRSNPTWASIPAIVVSAKAQPADIKATQKAGADACLIKPFSAAELRRTIQHYLPSPPAKA